MKASDWQELQRLLILADRQGFVQEALVETGIARKEQLPIVPGQKFQACLRGETTTDWKGYAQVGTGMMIPKAKPKPAAKQMVFKGGESSECSGSTGTTAGAMSDASKRRLSVDEDWEKVMEEPGSAEDDDEFAYQMPYGAPFLPANQLGVPPITEAERGFSPGVAYDQVNPRIPIPRTCKTAMEWGRTLVVMPKFNMRDWSIKHLLEMMLWCITWSGLQRPMVPSIWKGLCVHKVLIWLDMSCMSMWSFRKGILLWNFEGNWSEPWCGWD